MLVGRLGSRFVLFLVAVVSPLGLDAQSQVPRERAAHEQLFRHRLADPSVWEFQGVEAFSVRQIASCVANTSEFLRASYPNSKDTDVLASIRTAVIRGYLHRGFARVRVDVREVADNGRSTVRIAVTEGTKFLAGEVRVSGNTNISARRLIEWCQSARPEDRKPIPLRTNEQNQVTQHRELDGRLVEPPKNQLQAYADPIFEEPIWKPGTTKSLLPKAQADVKKYLQQAFEDQGFYVTQYDFEVIANNKNQTLELHIEIQKEGPRAKIGRLHLNGQIWNSQDEILSYLKLRPGQTISEHRATQLETQLHQSGRFLRHTVLVVPESRGISADIFLDVREYKGAPRLLEKLSTAQRAVVRLANWISRWPTSGKDLVIEFRCTADFKKRLVELNEMPFVNHLPVGVSRLIMSPTGGIILQTGAKLNGTRSEVPAFEYQLVLSADGMSRIDGVDASAFQFRGKRENSFFLQWVMTGVPKNPKDENVRLMLGLNFTPISRGHQLNFAPVTGVESLTHTDQLKTFETDTEFQLITKHAEIVFDRQSNGLKLARLIVDELDASGSEIRLMPSSGAYRRAKDAIEKTLAHRRVKPQKSSLRQILTVATGAGQQWLVEQQRMAIARKPEAGGNAKSSANASGNWLVGLLEPDVWTPVIKQINHIDKEVFFIPQNADMGGKFGMHMLYRVIGMALQSEENRSYGQLAAMLLPAITQSIGFEAPIFAFGSPPWMINRHQILRVAGGSQRAVMQALLSESNAIGPLACLYGMALSPVAEKKQFADRGLEVIDQFELDTQWLLDENSLSRSLMESVANAFAHQSPELVKEFLERLGGRKLSPFEIARILEPLDPDVKLSDQMLREFTNELWTHWYQPLVESYFQHLSWPGNKYLQELVQRAESRRNRGLLVRAIRDYNAALTVFDRIVDANAGKSTDVWVGKARGKLHFAIAQCTPANANRAELLASLISLQESIAAYEGPLAVIPFGELDDAGMESLRDLSEAYEAKGVIQQKLGRDVEAVEAYNLALSVFEKTGDKLNTKTSRLLMARKLTRLAKHLATANNEKARDGAKAIKAANMAVKLVGGISGEAFSAQAAALAELGEFDKAVAVQQMALKKATRDNKRIFESELQSYLVGKPTRQSPSQIALKGVERN